MKNCLHQAHADGLKSIAFPAIGAGTLNIPEDVVVKTLFEEIETFSREHPATSLKDIRFVIYTEVSYRYLYISNLTISIVLFS